MAERFFPGNRPVAYRMVEWCLCPRTVLVPSALESVFMAASIFSSASPCSPVAALSLAVVS